MNILMTISLNIIVILLYVAANFYVAKRVCQAIQLPLENVNRKLFYGVMFFLALILVFKFLLMFVSVNSGAKQVVNWIASYWMGLFVYLLLAFVVTDLIALVARGVGVLTMTRSIRNHISLFAMLAVVFICCGGIFNANQLEHVTYAVKTVNNPIVKEVNMVLISDLHLGAVDSEKRLKKAVQKINGLAPDIVCIAGDIFDSDYYAIPNPERASRLLQDIQSKYGVYACLGNHDAGNSFEEMEAFLERSNVKCLKDEAVVIDSQFILAGRLDSNPIGKAGDYQRKDISDILKDVDKSLPVVVMDHNPANIGEYQKDVDLILCGHTHHGQIWPGNLITDAINAVAYGHYQKDTKSPHVIVTSGAGIWGMPLRLGSFCEVVSVKLESK